MRKFVTWEVDTRFGFSETFTLPQTPELIVENMTRDLTYPTCLTGGPRFSLGVRPLPEGAEAPEDLPEDHPCQNASMQAGGSYQALTVDARVPDPEAGYTHYVVAREPVREPRSVGERGCP